MADYELPAYDDIVEGDPGDDDEEPVMDENERVARQEEEDARIAKELFEKEQKATQAEVTTLSLYTHMHVHVFVHASILPKAYWDVLQFG
jgi:hypothetical protein